MPDFLVWLAYDGLTRSTGVSWAIGVGELLAGAPHAF